MQKLIINVPRGTRYLSELVGNLLPDGLPNGIFNKQVCDCGATTLALTDEHKTIICSPRVQLLNNKHKQYPNTFVVQQGVKGAEIAEYIAKTEVPKILVTNDSLPKVANVIANKAVWRVVADEFHFFTLDSGFKSEVEFKALECLKRFPYVTYLSATPMPDGLVEQIEQFKDIPYTELQWEQYRKVFVNRIKSGRPIDAALSIIRKYQKGEFPKIEKDGKVIVSKECVIYINSVTNIVNLIKSSGLTPD